MVEIRVAVADATAANELLPRLSAPLDRSSISFDGTVPIASSLIETVTVRPPVGMRRPAVRWRRVHHCADRWRLLGGLAFSLLSLVACVLVARYVSDTSWPLEGAHVPLVLLAGGAYLASFGLRAFGWRQLFPSRERPDGARCLAACGASAASGVVLPFRLDYVVKIFTLRRLGGVRLELGTIAVSIVALGMVDAVAMLPLALAALATSGPILRAPLIVVVLFCIGCLGVITLGQRVARLPLVGRSDRLHTVYRRVADSTRFSPPTLVAGLLLLGCWTSRALGSTLLLSALGVRFSPTLAVVVLCMSAATAILPITAGGAVAGMGTTAGVLFALGVSKGTAVNFALASGLLLTGAALAAAALGLGGSLLLTFRARRVLNTEALTAYIGHPPSTSCLDRTGAQKWRARPLVRTAERNPYG